MQGINAPEPLAQQQPDANPVQFNIAEVRFLPVHMSHLVSSADSPRLL